ncbi:MAG: glycolate oxidase subunit GlcF [Nevskia sp.]|nr:glycolate oxidase subunit GlcF [Nevskia sp.]
METKLADWIRDTPDGQEADAILRACVHCGFCNATCPTYQLYGDELDGPRGRIYQIKQVLEGAAPARATQVHLDRCLTCRNCETTCPSGVQYGRLLDIGRRLVDARQPRPARERLLRGLLRAGLTRRWLFDPAMRLGQALRGLMPPVLRVKVPPRRAPGRLPARTHARKVLLLNGCVQPAMAPSIDAATVRVLDALGVQALVEPRSGCCGAIRWHLNAQAQALDDLRRNIDAWWPHVEAGAEAIVVNASGCGVMLKDYAHILRDDPAYAARAQRIVSLTLDLCEFLERALGAGLPAAFVPAPARIAFHPPCTLQHGQKLGGRVEALLRRFGAELLPVADAHLCCGSAGTYSVLQASAAATLRDRKLAELTRAAPEAILSANIGCLTHLQSGTPVPVRHWIEWVDQRLARS